LADFTLQPQQPYPDWNAPKNFTTFPNKVTKEDNIWALGIILFQFLNGKKPIEDPEFLGGKWRFKNWDTVLSREAFVLVNSMMNWSESERLAIGDVVGSIWMRTIANSKGVDVDEVRLRVREGKGGELLDVEEGEEMCEEKKKAIAEFNNDSAEAMESFENIVKLESMFKGTIIICVLLLCTLFFFYWSFEDDMKIHCIVMAVFTMGLLVSALA
jgi:serine/threonine protein kinase